MFLTGFVLDVIIKVTTELFGRGPLMGRTGCSRILVQEKKIAAGSSIKLRVEKHSSLLDIMP